MIAKPPRFFYFVEGINADLGDVAGWYLRAERWVDFQTRDYADSFGYRVSAWNRWLFQHRNIDNAARCLDESWNRARQLVMVGHSNGCAILCGALAEWYSAGWPPMYGAELHLIAAAVDADFEANGLNAAVARGQVGRIVLYCSESDSALKWAKETSWLRRVCSKWGYGSLGLTGPENLSPAAAAVTECRWRNDFNHSTWFEPRHFEETMRELTA